MTYGYNYPFASGLDMGGLTEPGNASLSYIMNGYGIAAAGANPNWSAMTTNGSYYCWNLVKIKNPSTKFGFTEGGGQFTNYSTLLTWPGAGYTSNGQMYFPHTKRANAVYFDGHADSIAKSDIPTDTAGIQSFLTFY